MAEETQVQEVQTKTYSQEQVDQMLAEGRAKALEEAHKKAEERFTQKQKEAEKLAKMNENEKFQYELEKREKAIEAKERELTLAENKNQAGIILNEKGLSLSLVDFVVAEDAETMKSNIDLLERAFRQSVKAEVEKRMGSNTPKKNMSMDDGMTREMFNKLPLPEQQRLVNENPDIIKQFYNI